MAFVCRGLPPEVRANAVRYQQNVQPLHFGQMRIRTARRRCRLLAGSRSASGFGRRSVSSLVYPVCDKTRSSRTASIKLVDIW